MTSCDVGPMTPYTPPPHFGDKQELQRPIEVAGLNWG